MIAGSIPAAAARRNKSTNGRASQTRRWQPSRKRPSLTALRVRLPLLPLLVAISLREMGSARGASGLRSRALGRVAQAPVFQTGQAGSTPAGHFGDK